MEQKYCECGCGKVAIYQLKSGKWICSTSVNKCEAMKEKNSKANLGKPKYNLRGDKHPRPMLGKHSWNFGLTKNNDKRLKSMSEQRKGVTPKYAGKASTPEKEILRKKNISKAMKIVGGGFRERSGRGKQGQYKDYWCQSSWELAWVVYSLDHGIKFERSTQGFEYEFEGKKHKYYPDFKLENGTYVEVKGYDSPQWEAKKQQFNHSLKIVDKEGINQYIKYVTEKYGENFVRLYTES